MIDTISERTTAELERFSLSLNILIEFESFLIVCCLFVTTNIYFFFCSQKILHTERDPPTMPHEKGTGEMP